MLSADEALRIGFLRAVVEPHALLAEARGLAEDLAGKSPLGLRLTREALDLSAGAMTLRRLTVRMETRLFDA